MELAALVTLRLTPAILGFASAELTKVFGSLGHDMLEEFHLDPPQLFSWLRMSATAWRSRGAV